MKRAIPLKHYFLRNISPAIRILVVSDALILGAAGFLGPVFALFIEEFIRDSDAGVVGIAAAIYLLSKSLFQIPAALVIDKIRGEKDDYYFMVVFGFIAAVLPLFYLAIHEAWQLYLVQFALGLMTACTYPSFLAIFTRHIDRKREGVEWGIYSTFTDLGGAAFAAIGGYIAATVGFPFLIILVVAFAVIGVVLLTPLRPYLYKR